MKHNYRFCLSVLSASLASCGVYQSGPKQSTDSDASVYFDAGGAGNGGTGGSGKKDSGQIIVPLDRCITNPNNNKSCPEICPEVCDGMDNDCDGVTDNDPKASQECVYSHAVGKCQNGACVLDKCQELFGDCDKDPSNGCETPLDMFGNCGKCGQSCAGVKNASDAACDNGECVFGKCRMGFGDCDGDKSNGCETALDDMDNCGACGKKCSEKSCAGGVCTSVSCDKGTADCDGDASNGCETSLTSVTNCIMCGNACSLENATASCEKGTCEFVQCKVGFGDCDNDTSNGCERRLDDMYNCGACGVECVVSVGVGFCTGGACTEIKCLEGKADCDKNPDNSCEAALDTNDNCGFCGNKCEVVASATTSCTSGSCQIVDCAPGTYDCDKDPLTGCESDLKDLANCGECGKTCVLPNSVTSCVNGACKFTQCESGFNDCNNDTSDGCEADFGSVDHCGACDNVCPVPANATAICNGGACGIGQCNKGWGDCNNKAADGCETTLPPHTDCKGCESGYGDCNNKTDDGCESHLTGDMNNCGKCGNACIIILQNCQNGTCCTLGLC